MTETGWIVVAAVGIIIVGGIWWARRVPVEDKKVGGDVHQTDTKP